QAGLPRSGQKGNTLPSGARTGTNCSTGPTAHVPRTLAGIYFPACVVDDLSVTNFQACCPLITNYLYLFARCKKQSSFPSSVIISDKYVCAVKDRTPAYLG